MTIPDLRGQVSKVCEFCCIQLRTVLKAVPKEENNSDASSPTPKVPKAKAKAKAKAGKKHKKSSKK